MLTREKVEEVLKMFDNVNLASEVGRNLIVDKIMKLSNEHTVPISYDVLVPRYGDESTSLTRSYGWVSNHDKSQDK